MIRFTVETSESCRRDSDHIVLLVDAAMAIARPQKSTFGISAVCPIAFELGRLLPVFPVFHQANQ